MFGRAFMREFIVIFIPSFLEISLNGLRTLLNLKTFTILMLMLETPKVYMQAHTTIEKSRIFQGFRK